MENRREIESEVGNDRVKNLGVKGVGRQDSRRLQYNNTHNVRNNN